MSKTKPLVWRSRIIMLESDFAFTHGMSGVEKSGPAKSVQGLQTALLGFLRIPEESA
jgi:hypothetical protein